MTDDKLLVDVLRAAGHEDAANLAGRLLESRPAPAEPERPEQPAKSPDQVAAEQFLEQIQSKQTPHVSIPALRFMGD